MDKKIGVGHYRQSGHIRLATKSLRFFPHFHFLFFLFIRTLVLINVRAITIDDLSPTIRQRKNVPLVEVYGLLVEESRESDFEGPLSSKRLSRSKFDRDRNKW